MHTPIVTNPMGISRRILGFPTPLEFAAHRSYVIWKIAAINGGQ
jgi:hypothetical protein